MNLFKGEKPRDYIYIDPIADDCIVWYKFCLLMNKWTEDLLKCIKHKNCHIFFRKVRIFIQLWKK